MQELATLTTFVNLLALAVSLWLGFYVITRSVYSTASRLATLTLWALAGYFLHDAIAINLPGSGILTWLRQTVIVVLPLWFHLSVLLLPPAAALSGRGRSINRVAVPLAYLIALGLISVGLFSRDLLAQVESRPAFYTSSRLPGPLYPLFLLFLALLFGLSLLNLWRAREQALGDPNLRSRLDTLLLATLLAGLGGLWNSAGTWLQLDLPTLLGDGGLGAGVILLGYAVARYSALLEGRPLDRDFIYAILVVGALTAFYVFVVFLLYLGGQVTFLTLILTIVGTVAANSLFDGIRLGLDRVFYQRQFQSLRANLRALAREAGTAGSLSERLQSILSALCRAFLIRRGFIALRKGDQFVVEATLDGNPSGQTFDYTALAAHESVGLLHASKKGLQGMSLLIPLFASGSQIGAVVLGNKESKQAYTDADLDLLEDLSDQIAALVHGIAAQEENAQAIDGMVNKFRERERALEMQVQQLMAAREEPSRSTGQALSEETLLPKVEDALRRLHDLAYLGEHPLAKLILVEQCLRARQDRNITSLDRGKALGEVLVQALMELRPDGPEPKREQVPSREWQPFIILHDSYVLEEPNRDIMSRLYVGEGTFNRTRRRALRSLAKALAEMEVAATANAG